MSPSVEHGGKAFEKSGAAPPVVIAMPEDESHVGADDKVKKDARFTKYAKGLNYFRVAKYLFFLLAMVGIIVLALQVNKGKSCCQSHKLVMLRLIHATGADQDTIQKLSHEMGTATRAHGEVVEDHTGGRMSYLEGFSGMVDGDDTAMLAARDVMASSDPSTATSNAVPTSVLTVTSTIASNIGETSATGTCNSTGDTTVNVLKTTTTFLPSASSTSATEELTTTS